MFPFCLFSFNLLGSKSQLGSHHSWQLREWMEEGGERESHATNCQFISKLALIFRQKIYCFSFFLVNRHGSDYVGVLQWHNNRLLHYPNGLVRRSIWCDLHPHVAIQEVRIIMWSSEGRILFFLISFLQALVEVSLNCFHSRLGRLYGQTDPKIIAAWNDGVTAIIALIDCQNHLITTTSHVKELEHEARGRPTMKIRRRWSGGWN